MFEQAKRAISLPREIESGRRSFVAATAAFQTITEEAKDEEEVSKVAGETAKTAAVKGTASSLVSSTDKSGNDSDQRKNASPLVPALENTFNAAIAKRADKPFSFVPDLVVGHAWQAPNTADGNSLRSFSAKTASYQLEEIPKLKFAPTTATAGGLAALLNQPPKLSDRKIFDYASTSFSLAKQKMWSLNESRNKQPTLPPAIKPNSLVVQSTNPYLVESPDTILRKSHSQSQFQWPLASRGRAQQTVYPHLPPAMPSLFKVKKEKAIIKSRAPVGSRSPPTLSTFARSFVLEKREANAKLPSKQLENNR